MLHRVILSGMCPPSNPAGRSLEGGALLKARCAFMQKRRASLSWVLAVSAPETVQQPTAGAALKNWDRLQASIITIIGMMMIINLC